MAMTPNPWPNPATRTTLRPANHPAAVILSSVVVLLTMGATLAGLLIDRIYTGDPAVAEMLRGYDLVTLVLAAPALALSVMPARHGSDRAQLVWTGTLAYLTYTYAFTVFGTAFNDLFLLHTAAFSASLFGLVLAVATVDAAGVARRFSARTPRRAVASVLALLAAGLGGMWIHAVLRNAVTGEIPPGSALVEPDGVVHLGIALDLAVLVPLYAAAAVLLWRRASWGYLLATIALVSGTLHQISYLVAMPFQAAADVPGAVTFDPLEPVIALLYVLAGGTLLWCAGRGARGPQGTPDPHRQGRSVRRVRVGRPLRRTARAAKLVE